MQKHELIAKAANVLRENNIKKQVHIDKRILKFTDITYKSGSVKSSQTYYRINLQDIKNINVLNIYFTVLSGNADMYIYSDNEHKSLIEKKNYRHAYKKEIIEITEDFLENYYISIVLYESSYFEIKYDININEKEYILLNNEVNIEYLNKEQDYKNYTIKTDFENNYLSIKSLDCSFNFEIEGINQEKNITYKYYEFSEKDFKFNLKLEEYFNIISNNNEDCTIFIATGTKSDSKNSLLIPENIPNPSFSFINTYYNFSFVYDEYFNGILINLELDSIIESNISPDLKITFIIEDQEKYNYDKYYIHKSKLIFIQSDIEKYCKINNICNIQMQIESLDSSSEQNYYTIYTMFHLENSLAPIYINKNQIYNEKILSLGSKYFYTSIDENEEGEINIMFNKGSGKIFAKIVEKNIIEKNQNWNRRIHLPEEDSEDLLKFDSIKGSLKYYSNNYNNCINGCELYILVKGNETTEVPRVFNEFSFSIDKKRKDIEQNGVINLLLNKYIKGNFTKNVYKYYTFTINFDIKKISINFYSYYGRLFIKLGKGHIANEQAYDWEFRGNSDSAHRLIISSEDPKIGKKSLKNISFSIGIVPSDSYREDNMNSYYFLQVQTLHNDNVNYYYLESERSIICNTGDYEYCYVIIPLIDINIYRDTVIYASSLTNKENEINILSKYYFGNEIDNISYTESIAQKFPTEKNYEQSSEGKKYLLLDYAKMILNEYILLTIDVKEKNNLIKIILSPSSQIIKTSLPPFTERLIYINKNEKINFTILDDDHPSKNYCLNIKTLSGISELILGENDHYSEINGNYVNEISPYYKTPMQVNNVNDYNIPNILIISYTQGRDDGIKEYDIIKNINNEISFSLTENPFPQHPHFGMKDKNIKMNIYFYDIEYKRYRLSQNLFNIDAMVLSDEDVFDVVGNYLLYENIGLIDFKINNGKINNGGYDVYTFVQRAYGNENEYKKIKEQITISEVEQNNEIRIVPRAKYFYSLNENNNENEDKISLVLTKYTNKNVIWLIDITENIPVLNKFKYTIKIADKYISDYKSYDYMGKKRIIFNDSYYYNQENEIKLNIERNINNNSIHANLTVQYYTIFDFSSIKEYKDFDNSFEIKISEERKNVTFKNILHYYNNSISKVVYYIDIFNKTEECDNYNKINTVFLGNRDNKNIVFSNIIDWLKADYESYTQYIPKELDNDILIRIVASFINNNGFEERIVYKPKEDKKDDDNDNKSDDSSFSFLYIIIPFIILIIIIIIIVIYLKKQDNKENEEETNNINNTKIEPLSISNLEESKMSEDKEK